ncbi:lysoplasmalogenase [Patella vulgata]|uniref:lysoplasmalogenase n=1 Tax=Patella vulgata TaxID=6465 RepID=UPI0024A86933|nr:lysoplasmalogenase [Patella vulgata]
MDRQLLSRLKDVQLIPFYITTTLFFIVCKPHLDYPPETFLTAALKILPIISLAGYLIFNFNDATKSQGIYTNMITCGLLVSVLGDICIVWREVLFLPGVYFFGVAHMFYSLGLLTTYGKSKNKALFAYLAIASFLCIAGGINSWFKIGVLFTYNCLVTNVGFLGVARYEQEQSLSAKLAAYGGVLFMISDFIIAVDRWKFGILGSEFLVMIAYYGAQACLALSTLKEH